MRSLTTNNAVNPTCANCRFFRETPMQPEMGTCRHNPPSGVMIPMNTAMGQQLGVQGFWPPTPPAEWCAKHEPVPVDLVAQN